MKHTKMIRDLFIALVLVVVFALLIVLMSSQQYRTIRKLRIDNLKLKHDNRTLLDSITRIQNDSLYKLFKIEQSCGIEFKNCSNQFSIKHLDTMKYYCKYFNVPERIFFRLVYKESRFDSTAYNKSSYATGYCQITPVWWYSYHGDDYEYHEVNRIKCSLRGLNELYASFGTWEKTLSYYNCGNAHNNETDKYVNWILK